MLDQVPEFDRFKERLVKSVNHIGTDLEICSVNLCAAFIQRPKHLSELATGVAQVSANSAVPAPPHHSFDCLH